MRENTTIIQKSQSWKIFDKISGKYDFLNHILSFGMDIWWRRRLSYFLPEKKELKILDLATGTADVLLSFVRNNTNIGSAFGVDLSEKMLELGRKKIERTSFSDKIRLVRGNAEKIPFDDDTFDCVSMAFGIRNVNNVNKVLEEMKRVLSEDGRALILEFSLPENTIFRKIHLLYLRIIVPLIGYIFSGDKKAYRYLNQSIEKFPYGECFCGLMRKSGFEKVEFFTFFGGVATVYKGIIL